MTVHNRRVVKTALAILVLMLTSCGAKVVHGAPAANVSVVPEVLRFTAPRVGGGTVDATAYAGRPVAFWFWAPG